MIFDFSFAEKPQHGHFFCRFLACSARRFFEVDVNVHFDWTLTSNRVDAYARFSCLIVKEMEQKSRSVGIMGLPLGPVLLGTLPVARRPGPSGKLGPVLLATVPRRGRAGGFVALQRPGLKRGPI